MSQVFGTADLPINNAGAGYRCTNGRPRKSGSYAGLMVSGQNNWMAKAKWMLTLDGFEIDEAIQNEDRWQIRLHVTSKTAPCPCCVWRIKSAYS